MFNISSSEAARSNENFRQVLFTGEHTQVVAMTLKAGEDIGLETHHHNDQILWLMEGSAHITVGDEEGDARAGDIVAVPAGNRHNVANTGEGQLRLITIYGPPDHKPGTVHATKSDALKDEGPPEK
jgi:mannose-6-phosphate isomerase-like protein (cupin superfamily)